MDYLKKFALKMKQQLEDIKNWIEETESQPQFKKYDLGVLSIQQEIDELQFYFEAVQRQKMANCEDWVDFHSPYVLEQAEACNSYAAKAEKTSNRLLEIETAISDERKESKRKNKKVIWKNHKNLEETLAATHEEVVGLHAEAFIISKRFPDIKEEIFDLHSNILKNVNSCMKVAKAKKEQLIQAELPSLIEEARTIQGWTDDLSSQVDKARDVAMSRNTRLFHYETCKSDIQSVSQSYKKLEFRGREIIEKGHYMAHEVGLKLHNIDASLQKLQDKLQILRENLELQEKGTEEQLEMSQLSLYDDVMIPLDDAGQTTGEGCRPKKQVNAGMKTSPVFEEQITIEGFLQRKRESAAGGKRATSRSWKNLYTVVCGRLLYFFKDQKHFASGNATKEPINLLGARCSVAGDYAKKDFVFRLQPTDHSSYLFQAPSATKFSDWLMIIKLTSKLQELHPRRASATETRRYSVAENDRRSYVVEESTNRRDNKFSLADDSKHSTYRQCKRSFSVDDLIYENEGANIGAVGGIKNEDSHTERSTPVVDKEEFYP